MKMPASTVLSGSFDERLYAPGYEAASRQIGHPLALVGARSMASGLSDDWPTGSYGLGTAVWSESASNRNGLCAGVAASGYFRCFIFYVIVTCLVIMLILHYILLLHKMERQN